VLTVVGLGLIAGVSRAQPLADRVPADALFYMAWGGSEQMGPGYAGSHLEAVLKESKLGDVISQSLPKMMQKLGANEPQAVEVAAVVSSVAGPMWRRPTAMYFGGIDPPAGPNAPPTPRVAVLCDAGRDGPALAEQLKKLTAQARAPFPIVVQEQGGLVVLSIGAKGWGAGQRPAAPLATATKFTSAMAQVQKSPVVAVYLDVEGAVNLVNAMAGNGPEAQNWTKARDALGLGGVKRAAWSAGFDGKDWMSQSFVEAPAPRRGAIPSMLDAKPLSDAILKTIPQTATVAVAGKFDFGALIAGIRQAAAQVDPQAGQAVDGFFAQVRDAIGVDLQKDLFDVLGDEWAVYCDPMAAGQGLLGFSLVNRARDAAKLEQSLTKLEDIANGLIRQNTQNDTPMTIEVKRSAVNGATMHHLAVPLVAPAWAVKDGNWYAGLYPQVVEAAIEQGGGRGKSILDNEDFQALRKRLGNVPASGVSFMNLPKTAPDGYQEVLMITRMYLGVADMVGADTPAMAIPPLRKIMPHLTPAGGVSWTDGQGWHSKSVSPFPGSTALTPGGGGQMIVGQQALLASILLPSLNRARETANRVKCASNMRQIGMGILMYSNENRGKYPPDLGTVLATQDLTPDVFTCPSGDGPAGPPPVAPGPNAQPGSPEHKKWQADLTAWVNENSPYVYLGAGMNNTVGADVIVLYEKPEDHAQGMNMLFGDGHVEFVLMSEAQRKIEAQKAKKGGRL
jgi:prepilin-type processing-associated H-X9-DG protein